MTFTPIDATVGGLLIGMSVAGMLLFHGRVSGMSGQLSNFIVQLGTPLFTRPERRQPRFMFYIGGLIAAGVLLKLILSPYEAFNAFSFSDATLYLLWKPGMSSILNQPLIMFGLSGLLVGMGTAMANGCTSGHMICGVSRASKRSITATAVFCTVALLIVQFLHRDTMLHEYYHMDMPPSYFTYTFFVFPSILRFLGMVLVLMAVATGYLVFYLLGMDEMSAHKDDDDRWVLLMYFFNAIVFGIGLGYSGMTVPQKVLGFFAVGSTHWDPSLACVALGAMVPNFFLYQTYVKRQIMSGKKPLYAKKFDIPLNNAIDFNLIAGALLFGVGWGISGICPGPAIVSLLFRGEMWLYMAGYVAGIKLKRVLFDQEKVIPPRDHIITSNAATGGPSRAFGSSMGSESLLKFRGRP